MNEAAVIRKFKKEVKLNWPSAWFYKIPDTKGLGGMRPFDIIIIVKGWTFCIEAKREDILDITPWQDFNLKEVNREGATIFVLNRDNLYHTIQNMGELLNGGRN